MKKGKKNNKLKSGINSTGNPPEKSENDFIAGEEDSLLFDKISGYMMGRFDKEDVLNDSDLPEVENNVNEWIKEYKKNGLRNEVNRKFVEDTLAEVRNEKQIEDEINQIKKEINKKNINKIAEDWVKDWNEEKNKSDDSNPEKNEIRNFISESLESPGTGTDETESLKEDKEDKKVRKSLFLRYLLLSAAAVTGVFILIKTLLPSSGPDKLFNLYYKPFDAVSDVIRNPGSNSPDSYQSAIINYRSGDYQSALKDLSDIFNKDTTAIMPRFFLGITHLAMGNYEQAVNYLIYISVTPGDFQKEALWYLGLTYLKTGEIEKSAQCFDLLKQSSLYYKDKAEEILRRLK